MTANADKLTADKVLTPNYGKRDIVLERGKGALVWDTDGREYLDFLAGISVVNLGHCHPKVSAAIKAQSERLVHCSNLYLIPHQVALAEKLTSTCFADFAFFCNSGAEANEAAIKLARLFAKSNGNNSRYEIISMRDSFHGRTLATLTATGQDKVQKGFEPLPVGFRYAEFNDLDSVRESITSVTCAVLVEPVQGEGGVRAATPEFLRGLRALCDEYGILLIFDEIQCGMGRCGKMFAHQHYGVEPDIMTLAKALGNGFPIGAMLSRRNVGEVLGAGTHGSTFGGNPLGCAAALAVLEVFADEDIPHAAASIGKYFRDQATARLLSLPGVKGLRGLGLMIGIELEHPGAAVVKTCAFEGLLINCTMGNILRLLPPLNVSREQCDRAIDIIAGALTIQNSETLDTVSSSQSKTVQE